MSPRGVNRTWRWLVSVEKSLATTTIGKVPAETHHFKMHVKRVGTSGVCRMTRHYGDTIIGSVTVLLVSR